jgi:hypothetical protein
LRRTKIPAFNCPSDRSSPNTSPGNNYVVSCGPSLFWKVSAASQVGVFNYGRPINVRDMLDGTSNVVAISESIKGDGTLPSSDSAALTDLALIVRGGSNPSINYATQPFSTQGAILGASPQFTGSGHNGNGRLEWGIGTLGYTVFNTLATPNFLRPDEIICTGCTSFDNTGVFSARSKHTGGVQATMGDGSVRFFSDNIDISTWQNLGHIADGNMLGEY